MEISCTCGHEYGPSDETVRRFVPFNDTSKEVEAYICSKCKKRSNFHLTGNEGFGVNFPLMPNKIFTEK
jgi:hypothetical protein